MAISQETRSIEKKAQVAPSRFPYEYKTIRGRYVASLRPDANDHDAFLFILWIVSLPDFNDFFPEELDEKKYRSEFRISEKKFRQALWCGRDTSVLSEESIVVGDGKSSHFHHIISQRVINIFLQRIHNHEITNIGIEEFGIGDRETYLSRARRLLNHPLNVIPVTHKENWQI